MPSKKKKYNARFPAGRIKKIMQSDEEVGKVAQAVPIIISKTLELFVESLLEKTLRITNSRNAKTLSPSHMKQCIMAESRFDFLRELVKNIPDISVAEEIGHESSPGPPNQGPYDLSMPSTSGATIQTPPPTNGRTSFGNGIQMHTATPPIQRSVSVPTATRLSDRKRLLNSTNEINNISANFYKENSVIQHTSDMKEAAPSPTKMMRMDSTQHTSHSSSKISARRLQHQSKSIPCTSKESHQPPIITPAPIINIDICNRPIVKIDYSNLALHDTEPIECTSITEDESIMSSSCISPVINIDLSKITPQPSSSLQNAVKDKTTNASVLELDEDYDNI